mgnify:CR=1 FL=1
MRDITRAERNWLETKAMPNYLIYSKANERAYCVSCKTEFDAKKLPTRKIGKEVACPYCGEKSKIKNEKFTNQYTEFGTAIIPDREDDHLILRYFFMERHFISGWREYRIEYTERVREKYDMHGNISVTDKPWNGDWKVCKLPYKYYQISSYTHRPLGTHIGLVSDNVSIYIKNITSYIKGTPMERVPEAKIGRASCRERV